MIPLPRRSWLAGLAAALLSLAGPALADERPNIIVMLADDLGYGDLAIYNPDAKGEAPFATPIETPNLDALAEGGAVLTDVYASAPFCSPTRRAMITGRYQSRLGEWAEGYPSQPEGVVADEDPGFPLWLQAAGYQTACYGKWNIAGEYNLGEAGPGAHGFDDWLIIEHNTGYFHHTNNNVQNRGGKEGLFETGGKRVTDLKGEYLTDIFTDRALGFLDRAERDRPFFLYLPWSVPHGPLQDPYGEPPAGAWDQPEPRTPEAREVYVKMVEYLDSRIGKILAKLEATGELDNTLILFTSDNGGTQLAANNWPLRRAKQWLYEGGIRVPTIANWPDEIPAGVRVSQPGITMDVAVTALAAADALDYVPAGRRLDGINLLPFLENPGRSETRTLGWRSRIWSARQNDIRQEALRHGDWKLVRTYPYIGKGEFGEDYQDELFDLAEDIDESDDLSSARPEKLREMRDRLDAWRAEVVDEDADYQIPTPDQRAAAEKAAETKPQTAAPAATAPATEATLLHRFRFEGDYLDTEGALTARTSLDGAGTEAPLFVEDTPKGTAPSAPDQALRLGASEDKISGLEIPPEGLALPQGSLSLWIRTPGLSQTTYLLYQPPIVSGLALKGFGPDGSRLNLAVGGTGAPSAEGALRPNQWHHLAATWDNAADEATLYIDGEVAARATDLEPGAIAFIDRHRTRLGNWAPLAPDPGLLKHQYRGLVYDLQFYDGTLTPQEIRELHDSPGTTTETPK